MGLIKWLIKYFLSTLFICSLISFVLINSLAKTTEENFFIFNLKNTTLQDPEFTHNVILFYNYSKSYFAFYPNESILNLKFGEKNITIEKEDVVSEDRFKDVLLNKMFEGIYDGNLRDVGFETDISLKKINERLVSYSMLALIFSVIFGLGLFLFSGFILVGIDFIIVSLFCYPLNFLFLKLLNKIPVESPNFVKNFMSKLISNIYFVISNYLFYFLISGIVLLGVGILLKILKISLWFESWFEKKEK
ncbi:MAG: hypothetical protein QXO70_00805 [Candidatus Pacearchaeota archaeon]